MPRVKLDLPRTFSFSTKIPLRITDVNYGGHLGNDAVLSLVHEARVRFLDHMGYTEMDVAGAGLIMADAVIVYKSEGTYPLFLTVSVAADNVRRTNFDLFYLLADDTTGREIARAKTNMVCFDYAEKKITSLPEECKQKLLGLP